MHHWDGSVPYCSGRPPPAALPICVFKHDIIQRQGCMARTDGLTSVVTVLEGRYAMLKRQAPVNYE